jgi:hypothetical protein
MPHVHLELQNQATYLKGLTGLVFLMSQGIRPDTRVYAGTVKNARTAQFQNRTGVFGGARIMNKENTVHPSLPGKSSQRTFSTFRERVAGNLND